MKKLSVKKLALAGMLCALCVVGSVFSFPMFGSKCAPIQHMVNVTCAVLLGPWWGVGVAFVKAFAAQTGAVIAITGAIDIVADAEKAYCIRNGNAMMSSITGTGCQLSALTAAFVTANPGHPLEAAAAAVCAMGLAGETAHKRLTPLDGNSTYRNYIIDAIYNMTPDQLEEGANYEVR